jgi:hypothetical protein
MTGAGVMLIDESQPMIVGVQIDTAVQFHRQLLQVLGHTCLPTHACRDRSYHFGLGEELAGGVSNYRPIDGPGAGGSTDEE